MSAHAENRRPSLVCLLTAGMTLFLIGVGGMVTSKGAGMAVPDWPNTYGYKSGEEMARLFNLATEGVTAKLGFHICFGNRFGRSRFDRAYRPYFPGLLKARADQLVLEFAGRELSELDLWKEYGQDRELGAGVIDVKGFYTDSPEDVAARIRRVLTVCRPEKLYVNPDCGFGWSPRYMCNQKVRALAAGAVLARQQLNGSR
jgi:5-methyltetrahydropteroyltriglutamate--homocysteine methyltransferase